MAFYIEFIFLAKKVMIKIVASRDELDSPFFKKNKRYCEDWQQFINIRHGKIIAKVGVSALIIKAQIKKEALWNFEIKKTTQSNNSILIPSKYFVTNLSSITVSNYNLNVASFKIFRADFLSFLKLKLTKNRYPFFQNTIIQSDETEKIKTWEIWQTKSLKNLIVLEYNHEKSTLEMRFDNLFADFSFLSEMINMNKNLGIRF